MAQRTLFTIGHSTRTWQEFLAILQAWKIDTLVDVRTVPEVAHISFGSRRTAWPELPKVGIKYVHLKSLGGLRRAKRDSPNTGWQNASFRGYADYMQTAEFEQGLADLNALRRKSESASCVPRPSGGVPPPHDCRCRGLTRHSGEARYQRRPRPSRTSLLPLLKSRSDAGITRSSRIRCWPMSDVCWMAGHASALGILMPRPRTTMSVARSISLRCTL